MQLQQLHKFQQLHLLKHLDEVKNNELHFYHYRQENWGIFLLISSMHSTDKNHNDRWPKNQQPPLLQETIIEYKVRI